MHPKRRRVVNRRLRVVHLNRECGKTARFLISSPGFLLYYGFPGKKKTAGDAVKVTGTGSINECASLIVPGIPHILIELRQALISYQDHHMLLLTLECASCFLLPRPPALAPAWRHALCYRR